MPLTEYIQKHALHLVNSSILFLLTLKGFGLFGLNVIGISISQFINLSTISLYEIKILEIGNKLTVKEQVFDSND